MVDVNAVTFRGNAKDGGQQKALIVATGQQNAREWKRVSRGVR